MERLPRISAWPARREHLSLRQMLKLPLIALILATTACGATSREPCTQKDLAAIIAAHEARLAEKCFGQGADCHERKAENARFENELRSWTRCDKESGP